MSESSKQFGAARAWEAQTQSPLAEPVSGHSPPFGQLLPWYDFSVRPSTGVFGSTTIGVPAATVPQKALGKKFYRYFTAIVT